jgi:hypothetical protein
MDQTALKYMIYIYYLLIKRIYVYIFILRIGLGLGAVIPTLVLTSKV